MYRPRGQSASASPIRQVNRMSPGEQASRIGISPEPTATADVGETSQLEQNICLPAEAQPPRFLSNRLLRVGRSTGSVDRDPPVEAAEAKQQDESENGGCCDDDETEPVTE